MRILFLTDNFPPEGKLFAGYKNRWYADEDIDGIRVVRVKTYITANEGFLRRTLDYLSFMVMSFLAGLFQPRPDVIIGTSPQFFTVCSAWMLSVFKWRPFVFELRDLWPASIRAVGAMRDGFLLRLLEKADELGLTNVRMVDRQTKELMPRYWSLCDVSLITLKDDPLFSTVIPSKIFESMGMGLPIIISLPVGEATKLVEESGAGVVVVPENPVALKATILDLFQSDEKRKNLALASADSAKNFSRGEMAKEMMEVLDVVAK